MSLVVREQELGENMSRYLADRIASMPSVEVLPHCEVRELIGEDALEAVIVENTETGERRRIDARALFVFIGAEPHTEWLRGRVALDDGGYVLTGQDAAAAMRALEAGDGARRVTAAARDERAWRVRGRRCPQRLDPARRRRGRRRRDRHPAGAPVPRRPPGGGSAGSDVRLVKVAKRTGTSTERDREAHQRDDARRRGEVAPQGQQAWVGCKTAYHRV